jgi:hypothetical protein
MLRSIWDELEDMKRRIDETFGVFPTLPVPRFLLPTLPVAVEKPFVPTTDVFARGGDLVIHGCHGRAEDGEGVQGGRLLPRGAVLRNL